MAIILNDDSSSQFNSLCEQFVGDINKLVVSFRNCFEEQFLITHYKKIGDAGNNIISMYNDVFCTQMFPQLTEAWRESEASIQNMLENVDAGEDAIANATAEFDGLVERICGNLTALDELPVTNTEEPDIKEPERVFSALSDAASDLIREVEEARDSFVGTVNKLSEENSLILSLLPLSSILAGTVGTFGEYAVQQTDTLKDDFFEREARANENAKEANPSKTHTDYEGSAGGGEVGTASGLGNTAAGIAGGVGQGVGGVAAGIGAGAGGVASGVGGAAAGIASGVGGAASGVASGVGGAASGVASGVGGAVSGIGSGTAAGVGALFGAAVGAVAGAAVAGKNASNGRDGTAGIIVAGAGNEDKPKLKTGFRNKLKLYAHKLLNNTDGSITVFQELTHWMYRTAIDPGSNEKSEVLPFEITSQLMDIYEEFFKNLCPDLEPQQLNRDEAETRFKHIVYTENKDYFETEGDSQEYISHFATPMMYHHVAHMIKRQCSDGQPDKMLIYRTFSVIHDVVAAMRAREDKKAECDAFNVWAAKEIYSIIGEPIPNITAQETSAANTIPPAFDEAETVETTVTEPEAKEWEIYDKLLSENKELQERVSNLEKNLVSNAKEISKFYDDHGLLLNALLTGCVSFNEKKHKVESHLESENGSELNDSVFPVSERAKAIMARYLADVKGIVKQIDEQLAKRKDDQQRNYKYGSKLLSGFVSGISKISGFLPIAGNFFEGSDGKGVGSILASAVEPTRKYIVSKALDSKDCKRIYDNKLKKSIVSTLGNKYMPIVNNYLCYRYYKMDAAAFNTDVKNGKIQISRVYDYASSVVFAPTANNDFAYAVWMMVNVMDYCRYCHTKKVFNWTNQHSINNAINIQACKAVLLLQNQDESRCDDFFSDSINKYGWEKPREGIKMEDYVNK